MFIINNNKIGIFDSGIGGVTVLKEILKVLPNENYIYYSDSKNNPYGDKNDEEIIEIVNNIVNKLLESNCKAIVIACNTASAKAKDFLRSKYFKLPIIAIEPAYKMVNDFAYYKPTLVLATKATIESENFRKLYNKYNNHNTYLKPCSGLADLIEEGDKHRILEYLFNNLKEYVGKIENVVLGCTHYVLIKEELRNVLGDVEFFDGAEGVAKNLKEILFRNSLLSDSRVKGKLEFIDTNDSNRIRKEKSKRFYELLN